MVSDLRILELHVEFLELLPQSTVHGRQEEHPANKPAERMPPG